VPKNGKIIFFPALRPYLNFFFSMCIPIINEKINKSGIFSFGIKEKHCILWLLGNLKSGSSSLFPPLLFSFCFHQFRIVERYAPAGGNRAVFLKACL